MRIELTDERHTILVDSFLAYTIGIIVYFVCLHLYKRVTPLRKSNIPEPVTGSIIAALALFLITGLEITYKLDTRDRLLIYFFTAISINARVSDLLNGGRPLIVLLVLTLGYIAFQDVVGVIGTLEIGIASATLGLVLASLLGGPIAKLLLAQTKSAMLHRMA